MEKKIHPGRPKGSKNKSIIPASDYKIDLIEKVFLADVLIAIINAKRVLKLNDISIKKVLGQAVRTI